MPCLLAEPSPIVAWLQSPERAALFITVVGGAVIGLIIKFVVDLEKARRAIREAEVPKRVDPMPVPPPAAPPSAEMAALREQLRDAERQNLERERQQDLLRLRWENEVLLRQLQTSAHEREQLQNALTTERRVSDDLRAQVVLLERELGNAIVQPDDEAHTWIATPRDVFATPAPPRLPRPPKVP